MSFTRSNIRTWTSVPEKGLGLELNMFVTIDESKLVSYMAAFELASSKSKTCELTLLSQREI